MFTERAEELYSAEEEEEEKEDCGRNVGKN